MEFQERLPQFQTLLDGEADLAFFPISADLQYLTTVPRDIPNYGAVIHPGDWLEGAWLTPAHAPVLALPRMSAEFGGLERVKGIDLRVLGDFDDPQVFLKNILDSFDLPANPRIAIGDKALGETISGLHKLLPGATFISATDILRQ
ncbi:MAG: hypothetical protein AB8G95_15460, partial [Anaerolineae bacterium]